MKLLALTINGEDFGVSGGIPSGALGSSLVAVIIGYLLLAAIVLALFFIVWGGFSWMTSGGDKQKLESAKQKLTFAIIGLIIAFLAYFFINSIGYFFGVKLLG